MNRNALSEINQSDFNLLFESSGSTLPYCYSHTSSCVCVCVCVCVCLLCTLDVLVWFSVFWLNFLAKLVILFHALCYSHTSSYIRQRYHPAAQDRLPTEAKQGWAGQYWMGDSWEN